MTSPRYSPGGYYAGPSYPDTPIYDMLVSERGTPQIAPIRVPSAYEAMPSLAALPSALPALPAGPSQQQYTPPQAYPGAVGQPSQPGTAQPSPLQSAPLQQAPAPYFPQQTPPQRGYQDPRQQQQPQPQQQMRPVAPPRPAAPRPAAPPQMPNSYEDPYGGQQYQGRGY
jgi:hypothetical protein